MIARLVPLALFALAACGQQNDNVCQDPQFGNDGPVSECVHKWAYRMAGASDTAETVAKGVVEACLDVARAQANSRAGNDPAAAAQFLDETLDVAQRNAVFRVVQARAGHCDIP